MDDPLIVFVCSANGARHVVPLNIVALCVANDAPTLHEAQYIYALIRSLENGFFQRDLFSGYWQTRLNTALAPIRRVPAEVIMKIFMYCEEDFEFDSYDPAEQHWNYPWPLTQVCSSWREWVVDAPLLWTRPVLFFNQNCRNVSLAAKMHQLHISRSKECALDMIISCGSLDQENMPRTAIARCIIPNMKRIRTLQLIQLPFTCLVDVLEADPASFVQLESILIAGEHHIHRFHAQYFLWVAAGDTNHHKARITSLSNAPALREVSFYIPEGDIDPMDFGLPSAHLTHLNISNGIIEAHVAHEILRSCPLIEVLNLGAIPHIHDYTKLKSNPPILCTSLRSLSMDIGDMFEPSEFLDRLLFPNLKTLRCIMSLTTDETDGLIRLLARSGTKLTELTMDCYPRVQNLLLLLRASPTIQVLSLIHCVQLNNAFFSALTFAGVDGNPVLPVLQSLEILCARDEIHEEEDYRDNRDLENSCTFTDAYFVDMVVSRWRNASAGRSRLTHLGFSFHSEEDIPLSQDSMDQLMRLGKEGMELCLE